MGVTVPPEVHAVLGMLGMPWLSADVDVDEDEIR
jgi:hypothetical protein